MPLPANARLESAVPGVVEAGRHPVQRGDAFDDGEPKAAAGLFLAGRAIKALADARQGLGADARAVVAYAKFTRIKDDVDLASGGAIAHGVIQKIAHQQAQQQRLAGARDVFRVQVQA